MIPNGRAAKILLIDSNVYFAKKLGDALKREGFEVISSTQAAFALTTLEYDAPAAIVCATNLREMGALEIAKIIHAEGEFSAAQRLVDAAHLLATEPVSVQLRYLQTLTEIGVEKNTTVIFPVPVDFFSGLQKLLGKGDEAKSA